MIIPGNRLLSPETTPSYPTLFFLGMVIVRRGGAAPPGRAEPVHPSAATADCVPGASPVTTGLFAFEGGPSPIGVGDRDPKVHAHESGPGSGHRMQWHR